MTEPAKKEEETDCPYGYEGCDGGDGDFENMCDECKSDVGQAHSEGMQETFDF